MDTTAEVPEFKIARVGKDRKRRGAGVPLFGGGGKGAGLFAGATGGSGAGGAAGMAGLLGKVAVLGLIGTLSAGAWQVGRALRPEDTAAGAKPKLFADASHKYSDADLANVLRSNNRVMPNSMGYVSGSLDGMTPEERARKEAEAAEAARLAEEEARKAEEEAAKAEPADVAGSPAGMDPNALMKGVTDGKADKSGPFNKKFGALSSSFGGGLAGGSGLAGGVGRGFSNPSLNNKGSGGKAAPMRSAATRTKMSRARPARNSGSRGLASRQLRNANALSNQAAAASRPENAAQAADAAFSPNTGAGNVISGPGVSNGTGGSGIGDSGGSVNPNTGGPVNPGTDPNQLPSTPASKNVTKWQPLVMAAMGLLALIAVLSIIAMLCRDSIIGASMFPIIANIIGALGAMVALLGIAIMAANGQYIQGGIFTAMGATIATLAFTTPEFLGTSDANQLASLAAISLVSSAVGLLGGSVFGGKGGSSAMQ